MRNRYPAAHVTLARLAVLTGIPAVSYNKDFPADPMLRAEMVDGVYCCVETGKAVTCLAIDNEGIVIHKHGQSGTYGCILEGRTPKQLSDALRAYENVLDGIARARDMQARDALV